ncbi:MAG: hypothetical protein HYX68_23645 [Planctomycetes bacterium]|jgi:hypothetical protein|nr:hypothetical protein [Planctomycetota bacterium]
MSKQLMEIVLPRLARPLYQHLEAFQLGRLDELQFTKKFEKELQRQHCWLAQRGIDVAKAAVAIHAAVIVLSLPGLRSEADESKLPLEVLEFRAIREAANDVAENYGMDRARALQSISRLVARYAD